MAPFGCLLRTLALMRLSADTTNPLLIDYTGAGLITAKDAILKIKVPLLFYLNLGAAFVTIQASVGCLLSAILTQNARNFEITVGALHGYLRLSETYSSLSNLFRSLSRSRWFLLISRRNLLKRGSGKSRFRSLFSSENSMFRSMGISSGTSPSKILESLFPSSSIASVPPRSPIVDFYIGQRYRFVNIPAP